MNVVQIGKVSTFGQVPSGVAFLSVFVLSSIKRFCLACLPFRFVRSVHGLTTAGLADQFAADG